MQSKTNITEYTLSYYTKEGKRKRRRSDSVLWQKPLHPPKNPNSNVSAQKSNQNFDYTTIADWLRTVSWSNNSHPTGVVKPVYERPILPLTAKVV